MSRASNNGKEDGEWGVRVGGAGEGRRERKRVGMDNELITFYTSNLS